MPNALEWRKQWHPTPVLLPGKSYGRRSLEGCSPWGHWGSDTTEQLCFHFSLSCIGEGNGNPFQCSCLENPRDGGAWWAALCGVAQSLTRVKWLSSSSSVFSVFIDIYLFIFLNGFAWPLYKNSKIGLQVQISFLSELSPFHKELFPELFIVFIVRYCLILLFKNSTTTALGSFVRESLC